MGADPELPGIQLSSKENSNELERQISNVPRRPIVECGELKKKKERERERERTKTGNFCLCIKKIKLKRIINFV